MVVNLLTAIISYSVGGYSWLLYWCLLMVILLISIGGYYINGY